MGTNKQKAFFADFHTTPIRIKKAEKEVKVELNLEMGAEIAPAEIGTVEVPNVALGINGGMAAKVKIGGGITECLKKRN